MNNYVPIIGLEIHVELKTKSKMFCGCKNDPFHAPKPNMYTCPVCLGLPGALPVANKKAIEWTIKLGLALGCEIPLFSKFDRKNYFYPDLPKGYQISQYDQPLAVNGFLVIPSVVEESNLSVSGVRDPSTRRFTPSVGMTNKKRIRITRVHLEEDTGKLLHATVQGKKISLIDFNRSGVPLFEIVTEPDIHSSEEAKAFLKKLHQIVRYLDISDAEMEKGSMRLEPNISVSGRRLAVSGKRIELPNYKVEVKNINSFNFVKKAIDFEVNRHIELLDRGETPIQETRGWDEKKGVTYSQRIKEEAHDYRYFPDPDLPPMRWEKSQITNLKSQIPELPDEKIIRFVNTYQLPEVDAIRLTENKELADYFEKCIKYQVSSIKKNEVSAKDTANWLLNKKIHIVKISPEELIKQIAQAKRKVTVDPGLLQQVLQEVLLQNSKAVADYKAGKTGVLMFLVGQCMKELKGKADAQEICAKLEETLKT